MSRRSGTLEVVLARLADFLENQAKLQGKVGSAMAYPAFMTIMSLGIMGVMMTVVVPKVTSIFEDFEQALPWYTSLMIFISNLLINYWWALIGVTVGSVVWFRRWLATEAGRAKWLATMARLGRTAA